MFISVLLVFFLDFRIRTCKNEKNNVTKQEIDESWNYIG